MHVYLVYWLDKDGAFHSDTVFRDSDKAFIHAHHQQLDACQTNLDRDYYVAYVNMA